MCESRGKRDAIAKNRFKYIPRRSLYKYYAAGCNVSGGSLQYCYYYNNHRLLVTMKKIHRNFAIFYTTHQRNDK